jgi:hypothetical protein
MMREGAMSVYRFGLGLAVGLFFSTSLASAILIETGAGKVGGFVLNDDGTKLKISIPTRDGEDKVGEYLYSDIKILHRLDVKRLEGLSKDNPKAYRDYADELALHKDDPEARYVAMRLYLIAAHLAPTEFGSSSLLRMSALASRPAEARKLRAMAFLLDPKADDAIVKDDAGKPAQPAPLPAGALEDFTKALQLYRSGQIKLASETAKHDGVDTIFRMAPGKIDLKAFLQWCTDANCTTCRADGTVVCPNCQGKGVVVNMFRQLERCPTCKGKKRVPCPDCGGTHVRDPLPNDALRAVLRCELWAIDRQGGWDNRDGKDAAISKSWSAVLQSRQLSPVLPLSLDTITNFDPRMCRYRNRKWVAE